MAAVAPPPSSSVVTASTPLVHSARSSGAGLQRVLPFAARPLVTTVPSPTAVAGHATLVSRPADAVSARRVEAPLSSTRRPEAFMPEVAATVASVAAACTDADSVSASGTSCGGVDGNSGGVDAGNSGGAIGMGDPVAAAAVPTAAKQQGPSIPVESGRPASAGEDRREAVGIASSATPNTKRRALRQSTGGAAAAEVRRVASGLSTGTPESSSSSSRPSRPKRTSSDESFDRRRYVEGIGAGASPRLAAVSGRGSQKSGIGARSSGNLGKAASPETPNRRRATSPAVKEVASSSCVIGTEIQIREGQSLTPIATSSDGDVRCMAMVVVGHDITVWCGERDGSITVRDAQTAAVRHRLPQAEIEHDFVWVILQVDDAVWVGTSSARMRIYNAATRNLQVARIRHSGGIYALALLGRSIYSASNDFTILEWDKTTMDSTNKILSEHTNQVRCLCVCAGRLVSGGDDRSIRVWDGVRAESVHTFRLGDSVSALAYIPQSPKRASKGEDGCLWAGDNTGVITVFDWRLRKKIHELREHQGLVHSILRKQGLVMSSSADGTLKVWDPNSCSCLRSLSAHASYIAAMTPVSREVRTRIWSASADRVLRTWSLRDRSAVDEGIERLQDETEHLTLLNKQMQEDVSEARAAEIAAVNEAATLRDQLAEVERLRAETERDCNEKLTVQEQAIEEMKAELFQARRELELSRSRNESLQDELQLQRREYSDLSTRERDTADQLMATSAALAEVRAQLDEEKLIGSGLAGQLDEQSSRTAALQQDVDNVRVELAAADKERANLQDLVNEHEAIKVSRLAFASEVWNLHKKIGDVRKPLQAAVGSSKASQRASPSTAPKQAGNRVDTEEALATVQRAREQSTTIISKYFTDDEKLHLGIPLAQYEGGHKAAKPLEWDEACSEPAVSSTTQAATPSPSDSGSPRRGGAPQGTVSVDDVSETAAPLATAVVVPPAGLHQRKGKAPAENRTCGVSGTSTATEVDGRPDGASSTASSAPSSRVMRRSTAPAAGAAGTSAGAANRGQSSQAKPQRRGFGTSSPKTAVS